MRPGPKRPDPAIHIDPGEALSLQDQIRRGLIRAVAAGDLPRGSRAPSTRGLAAKLGVSRNTVLLAYQRLVADGFLIGRERSGLFVAPEPDAVGIGLGVIAGVDGGSASRPQISLLAPTPPDRSPWRIPPDWARHPYPFIDGLIDPSLFPTAEWREASRMALSARDVAAWASGLGDADDPMLVEEIVAKILPRRGIRARADEILITLGSQQAISIALALFASRRRVVAVEEPGYGDIAEMARLAGARLHHQPVDGDGLVVDERLADADLIIVTPSHQHPTGVTLSVDRRRALLDLADAHGAVIVEDDFECEMTYFEAAPPAMRAMSGGERVIYAASLSAVLGPALRLGFMVAQAEVIAEARRIRRLTIKHPPLVTQRAAAYFLSQGFYDKTMARTARVLRERRHALHEALNHYLQRWLTVDPRAGGTSYWVRGPEGVDARALAIEAQRRGILIEPVDRYFAGPAPPNVFRLGVTGLPASRIRPGVQALAGLVREQLSTSFDLERLAGALKSGEALRQAMAGATLLCRTVDGAPCTIELSPDGAMSGRAGYANEDRDEGRWWVAGDTWFRRWRSWGYGEESGYRPLIEGRRVQWLNAAGLAVDQAVYLAPGVDPAPSSEAAT